MQARYFIGIALPVELSRVIMGLQQEMPASSKLMQPLVPHITLLHPDLLADIPPAQFLPRIKKATETFLPLSIRLTHTGRFGKRVLYIAIECPQIMRLQKQLLQLLPEENQDVQGGKRNFTPHITLVQARRKQPLPEQQTRALDEQIELLLPFHFEAEQLAVFTWIKPRTYRVDLL